MTLEKNYSDRLFPIVAIGASAGGLNAFQCFLGLLPKDFGFAVVFVQHLSPMHRSLLPDLLRTRRPDLDIYEITDGLEIRPGNIYLCPPGEEIRVRKGFFERVPRPKVHLHLPIDEFFSALAEEMEERVIAVIFSGAGTDGARGIKAVRDAGGTVFVQDPGTAEFTGMPLAAIGIVQTDGVFSPEDIAREILKLHGPDAATPATPGAAITQEEFETFFSLLYGKTGYRFNHYKKSVISRRIIRRMYLNGISSVRDYMEMLEKKEPEPASLASDLMIGVTSFFRDRIAWKALRSEVVRKIVSAQDKTPVRVWTPACATGEEPYSVAMLLSSEIELAGVKREIQVFATDVNDRALEKARDGVYTGSVAADIPQDYMKKFFNYSEDGNSVIVSRGLRDQVVFAKHDILTDPPFSRLDLVICRNLLIYLEPEAQGKCVSIFHYALKDGGYLFLGNAESVGRSSMLFKSLGHKKCRVYQKVESEAASRLHLSVPFAAERTALTPTARKSALDEQPSVIGFVQENLLEEYTPAAVAINNYYDILYHSGPTNKYLQQPRGAPTQNLLDLISEHLRSKVRGAIYRVSKELKPVSVRTSFPVGDDGKKLVTLRISKLREDLFLIVFREKGGVPEQASIIPSEAPVDETVVRQLEGELSATRADLQSHIEQLKSLNEELQSSNEELQAANEELETSREELQSLNEELITVNGQFQSKIEEQEETNNDLINFLTSTNIPTFFLDEQFRVKRFTPAMSRLIKLIPGDIGRPIIDMSQDHLGPDLISDAMTVLDTLTQVKKEIRINDIWYIRTALPYRTLDNRIEGVIVTYNDITEIRLAEERTRHLASFPQLNPNPIIEVDALGKILFVNPVMEKILEVLGPDKTDPRAFLPLDLDVILRNWDGQSPSIFKREVRVGDRYFGETLHMVPQFNVVRIYAFDITERKQAEEERESAVEFLRLVNESRGTDDLIKAATSFFQENSGCEAVGIRLHEEHDYPYFETRGFSKEFVQMESRLCSCDQDGNTVLDDAGNPVLACMCGNVICGSFDPSKPFFTKRGSFWSNCTTELLASTTDADRQARTRNRCNGEGYESVALIGLSIGKERLGLLQLNDRRKGRFTPELIALWERLADYLAVALSKFQSDEALRESQKQNEFLANILEISSQPFGVGYPDGRLGLVNKAFEELTGYTGDELRSIDWANVLTPSEWREVEQKKLEELVNTRRPVRYEKEYIRKDGTRVPIELLVHIVSDADGNPQYYYSFLTDITERKRAEEALKESEEQYRSLFENLLDAFCYCKMIFDDGGQPIDYIYLEANSAFETMSGFTDVVGKKVTDVIPEVREAHPEMFELYGRVAMTGQPEKFEINFAPTGQWFDVSAYSTKKGYVAIIFDNITVRKKAEDEVRQHVEELERFNRAMVGRELRMIELKKEVNELRLQAGLTPEYLSDIDTEQG
ncbi:MAG: CheR family methyltransferase [Thermodesulfovibrionales bacterium]